MRNTLRGLAILTVAGGTALTGQALAVSSDGGDLPYFGAQYAHEFPDSARKSDNGSGFQLNLGVPLSGWSRTAIELTLADIGRKRELDGKKDYQTSLMVDLVRDLGTFGWESDSSVLPRFKPYGLAGLGAVQEDVRGEKHVHFGGNLGLGLLFPTSWHGLAVRTEGRVLVQQNGKKSVPDQDILTDFRLALGVQIPLWFLGETAAKPEPAEECGVRVVDAAGRPSAECGADSDRDGVADGADRCPGTPAGTMVDSRGCPMTEGFVLKGVNFKTDSAELTESSKAVLDNVAATLDAPNNKSIAVQIGGHTDASGSAAYNMMLSQQRAESVRQYLIGKGVDADRLKAEGFGPAQPVAPNETEKGKAENRRVEFRIVVE